MTLSNVINFGSALQTYATVKAVEKLGCQCQVIDYAYPSIWHTLHSPGCENIASGSGIKYIIKKILVKVNLLRLAIAINYYYLLWTKKSAGLHAFADFKKRFFSTTKRYNRKSIIKNPPAADIFVTGSDQTWNPRYTHSDFNFLLSFVSDDTPKLSYAASFGSSKLPDEYHHVYAQYLQRYERISVREKSGVDLVKQLTDQKAVHVLDPTLLLVKEEWELLANNKLDLPEQFIFCYILNYVFNPYPELGNLLKHLSEISGMPVVVCGIPPDSKVCNSTVLGLDIGPTGFLECFSRASFVVTTTFHGAAFSVNFRKNFFTILNPHSSSDDRVKSFLQSVNMTERGLLLQETDISSITVDNLKTDYTECEVSLKKMRDFSMNYLEEALNCACQKLEKN